MNECVKSAASWWSRQLRKDYKGPASCVDTFEHALFAAMKTKYEGHWYIDNPRKGSAFRSLSYDHRLDSMLQSSADKAGIKNPRELLRHVRFRVMFVNPGEVKILNTALMSTPANTIFSTAKGATTSSSSPPSGAASPVRHRSNSNTAPGTPFEKGDHRKFDTNRKIMNAPASRLNNINLNGTSGTNANGSASQSSSSAFLRSLSSSSSDSSSSSIWGDKSNKFHNAPNQSASSASSSSSSSSSSSTVYSNLSANNDRGRHTGVGNGSNSNSNGMMNDVGNQHTSNSSNGPRTPYRNKNKYRGSKGGSSQYGHNMAGGNGVMGGRGAANNGNNSNGDPRGRGGNHNHHHHQGHQHNRHYPHHHSSSRSGGR